MTNDLTAGDRKAVAAFERGELSASLHPEHVAGAPTAGALRTVLHERAAEIKDKADEIERMKAEVLNAIALHQPVRNQLTEAVDLLRDAESVVTRNAAWRRKRKVLLDAYDKEKEDELSDDDLELTPEEDAMVERAVRPPDEPPDLVLLELTKGYQTCLDSVDLVWAKEQGSWYANEQRGLVYANRSERRGGKRINRVLHREVLERMIGRELTADEFCDHINHDTLDNRRINLRVATRGQNQYNRRGSRDGTSQYKGVSWDASTGKWTAAIKVNGRSVYIGSSTDEEEAARLYDDAAREAFEEFAFLNFRGEYNCG